MVFSKLTQTQKPHTARLRTTTQYALAGMAALGLVFVLTTTTQAGFQWVPPSASDSQPQADIPVTREPTLPPPPRIMSSELPDMAPVAATPPSVPPPAMKSVEDLPKPVMQEARQKPVIKVIDKQGRLPEIAGQPNADQGVSTAPPPPAARGEDITWQEPTAPSSGATAAGAPPPAPASVMMETRTQPEILPPMKTIVPVDAPQSAMERTENPQRLNIDAYPPEQDLQQMPAGQNLRRIVTPQPHNPRRQPGHGDTPGTLMPYESAVPQAPSASGPGIPVEHIPSASMPPPAPPEQNFENAVGFGSEMPLAFALSQIVPAGYSYSFGPSVNPGARISWEGGKPWNQVVRDMVAPLGLDAAVVGNTIHIHNPNARHSSSTVAPTPAAQQDIQISQPENPAQMAMAPKTRIISNAPDVLKRARIMDPGENENMQPEIQSPLNPADMASPEATEPAAGVPETDTFSSTENINWNNNAAQNSAANIGEMSEKDAPINLLETANLEGDSISSMKVKETKNLLEPQQNSASDFWEASAGDSLKNTLKSWSTQAGIDLIWSAPHDYTLSSNILVTGNFENALRAVFKDGLRSEGATAEQPRMTLSQTPNGRARLTIESSAS